MVNYQVSDYMFELLCEIALHRPPLEHYQDLDYDNRMQGWKENLRRCLDQIVTEAWVKGAQWAMERQTEAYMIVTQEQYEALKEQANGEQA